MGLTSWFRACSCWLSNWAGSHLEIPLHYCAKRWWSVPSYFPVACFHAGHFPDDCRNASRFRDQKKSCGSLSQAWWPYMVSRRLHRCFMRFSDFVFLQRCRWLDDRLYREVGRWRNSDCRSQSFIRDFQFVYRRSGRTSLVPCPVHGRYGRCHSGRRAKRHRTGQQISDDHAVSPDSCPHRQGDYLARCH